MISTVDPQSRHTRKSRENWQEGFKAHLLVEPDTGLTTAAALTKTNGPDNSDAIIGGQLLDADPTIAAAGADPAAPGEDGPSGDQQVAERTEVLGDSAYGAGNQLDKINKAGWTAIIKPHPLRPAVAGGFTLDDFTYNEQAGTLTCPNQVTRPLSRTRTATFGRMCGGCPLRKRCTTSATGRVVKLTEFEQVRRDHRARAKQPDV